MILRNDPLERCLCVCVCAAVLNTHTQLMRVPAREIYRAGVHTH